MKTQLKGVSECPVCKGWGKTLKLALFGGRPIWSQCKHCNGKGQIVTFTKVEEESNART